MSAPDPRVKHPEGWPQGSHSSIRELVESVHARMDALGVPRVKFVEGQEFEAELTLLGRMDAALELIVPRDEARAEMAEGVVEQILRPYEPQLSADILSERIVAAVMREMRP